MSYNSDLQNNNADLRAILNTVNALPEAGTGETPEPVIQELTVTENGTYNPPDGVDGYSPVAVNVPIPEGYVKPSGTLNITENGTYDVTEKAGVTVAVEAPAPVLQSKTVTPTTGDQTVTPDSGFYGLDSITVKGDVNLVPENIVSGKSIFGVHGSYEGSGGSGDVETVTCTIIMGHQETTCSINYLDKTLNFNELRSVYIVDGLTLEVVKNSIIYVRGHCLTMNGAYRIDLYNDDECVACAYDDFDITVF